MVNCPNCGRENAAHFNFCLDCGTELKREGAEPGVPAEDSPAGADEGMAVPAAASGEATADPFGDIPTANRQAPIPPEAYPTSSGVFASAMPATFGPTSQPTAGMGLNRGQSVAPQKPASASRQSTLGPSPCPICNSMVPASMKFCGDCGARLDPSAPPPSASSQAAAAAKQTQFLHVSDLAAVRQPKAKLVVIDPTGKEGMTFSLKSGDTMCGRVNGMILFEDPCVSPTHCAFRLSAGKLVVEDRGSLNGVYVRIRTEIELKHGDSVRLGKQLLRFEDAPSIPEEPRERAPEDDSRLWGSPDPEPFGRLVQLLEDGRVGDVRVLKGNEVRMGREVGDIIFNTDGFVSAQHCVLTNRNGRVHLRDVGSSNGTYLKVRSEQPLMHDDILLVGNQMLRVDQR